MTQIDLNADLGEGSDGDADLMRIVTSCNIACGGHAGDDESMIEALARAKSSGISAGAHPSFPDRENFGRSPSNLSGDALIETLSYQVMTLQRHADERGVKLTHLKPHGALYNQAAKDSALAECVVRVLLTCLPHARLYGPPASCLQAAAARATIPFTAEGFADRAYEADGSLRSRDHEGAVIHDPISQARQALSIAQFARVKTYDGPQIDLPAQTICVHGDTLGACAAAKQIRQILIDNGIKICPPD